MKDELDRMAARANADSRFVSRGAHLSLTFKLDCGERYWLIDIDRGRVSGVRQGPALMPAYAFAIRSAEAHWHAHWEARPKPGWQDLFGMQRHHGLTLEGDIHVLVTNLFWFKDLLAMPRANAEAA